MTEQENIRIVRSLLKLYMFLPPSNEARAMTSMTIDYIVRKYKSVFITVETILQWTLEKYPSEITEHQRDDLFALIRSIYGIYSPNDEQIKERLIALAGPQQHKLNL